MWRERHSDAHFYMSAIFAKIGPKTFQNRQDGSPSCLKMAIWSPSATLAPSWRQVRPSCRHFGHPAPVQNRPRQPPRQFSCQDLFQDLPDPLPTSIFMVSGSIFGHILSNFLKTFNKDSVINLKASPKISSRVFFRKGLV